MLFPVYIFKEKGTGYGVVVPGLPGCFSYGRTMEEALVNTHEAIELHLEGIVEDGHDIPEQESVESYLREIKAGGVAAVVNIDTSAYEKKQSERVNVTFPKALLSKIDKASERLGTTRSGFLQKAAKSFMGEGRALSAAKSSTSNIGSATAKAMQPIEKPKRKPSDKKHTAKAG